MALTDSKPTYKEHPSLMLQVNGLKSGCSNASKSESESVPVSGQSSSCTGVLGGKVSLTVVFCFSVSDRGNATEYVTYRSPVCLDS